MKNGAEETGAIFSRKTGEWGFFYRLNVVAEGPPGGAADGVPASLGFGHTPTHDENDVPRICGERCPSRIANPRQWT